MTPSKRIIGLWPASGTGGRGTVASPLVSELLDCSTLLPGEWKAASGGLIGSAESAVAGLHKKLEGNASLGGGCIFLSTTPKGTKRVWQAWGACRGSLNTLASSPVDKVNRQFKGSEDKHAARPHYTTAAAVATPEHYGHRGVADQVGAAAEAHSAEASAKEEHQQRQPSRENSGRTAHPSVPERDSAGAGQWEMRIGGGVFHTGRGQIASCGLTFSGITRHNATRLQVHTTGHARGRPDPRGCTPGQHLRRKDYCIPAAHAASQGSRYPYPGIALPARHH
nr:unnamed protein product [Leishmania braziliensis]